MISCPSSDCDIALLVIRHIKSDINVSQLLTPRLLMDRPTFRYSGDTGVKMATLMACEIVTWG